MLLLMRWQEGRKDYRHCQLIVGASGRQPSLLPNHTSLGYNTVPSLADAGADLMFPEAVMSSAESLTGDLSIGHRNTSLGPVGLVEGAAPPAFRHTRTAVASHHTYHLTPSGLNQINLEFNATDLINTARSSGFGVDSIGTQATADIG